MCVDQYEEREKGGEDYAKRKRGKNKGRRKN